MQERSASQSHEDDSKQDAAVNPYIPKYISKAPCIWFHFTLGYTGNEAENLAHQKSILVTQLLPKKHQISIIHSTKYRKGACENCGSATHARRDCLERPRKIGAKWSGQDIGPDEIPSIPKDENPPVLPGIKLLSNYDEKRDNWKNFESTTFKEHVEPLYEGLLSRFVSKDASMEQEVDTIVNQKLDFESKSRMTVRNLRIREDTAKYLQKNVSKEAIYDPKTRSLRAPESGGPIQERWVRASFSDLSQLPTELDLFCWDPNRKSTLLPQTSPTQVALEFERYKKTAVNAKNQGSVEIDSEPAASASTEDSKPFVPIPTDENRSYATHSSAWGSFWNDGSWGYACCKSLDRNSACANR